MAVTTYVKTADPVILDRMSDILGSASDVIGDTDEGKVGVREAQFILGSLDLSPLGAIRNITTTNTTTQDSLLGAESFDPQLSSRAMQLYQNFSNLDTTRVELTFDLDTNISSPLFYANGVQGQAPELLSYAYLELYALYSASVEYAIGTIFPISDSELDRIVSNLRFAMSVISVIGDSQDVYKLLYVVNYIQRTILFIRYNILTILG